MLIYFNKIGDQNLLKKSRGCGKPFEQGIMPGAQNASGGQKPFYKYPAKA